MSLNTSKGVIRSSELSLFTLDELKSHLQTQSVTDIKRISIKRNDEIININTYIVTFNKSSLPKELKVGYNLIKVNPYIPNPLRCFNYQKFGHHETKCLKSPVCKKCGESGSDHIELSCDNPIKCANCQGNHPAYSRDCLVWKREKEINTLKYTNTEARKIIQSKNQFPARSYAQAATSNTDPKQHHSFQSCHSLLETLSKLTPETLPNFINDLKVSLSEDKQSKPFTPKQHASSQPKQPPKEVATQVAPPQKTQSPKSPVGRDTKSPNGGLRQSQTPRPRIQLEKPTQKIDFQYLRMRSRWSVGFCPRPPLPPRLTALGR